jgi:predicted enzyme related to lactoylglutathione lyase
MKLFFSILIFLVLFNPSNAQVQNDSMKIESLFQVIINVKNMETQVKFYRDVLGLKIIYPADTKNIYAETFVRFETGGAWLVLHGGRKTNNAGQEPRMSFRVKNIKAAREHILMKGYKAGDIRNPAPGVYVVDCKDPENNTFHLEASQIE